jgi:transposase
MANKSIVMIKVRRILQLRVAGTSKLEISRILQIHRATLDLYLLKLETTGKSFSDLLCLDDQTLGGLVYSPQNVAKPDNRYEILVLQFPYIKQELEKTGVTRKLLWEEYKTIFPEGYGYAQFCEHLSRHMQLNKATMHFSHRPGEFLQIDFAGKSLSYIDPETGEIIKCPVLVCTLPFSSYTYVEALASAKQEYLFAALNRCLEYFGGVPKNILSDNMKQYIQKNDRYQFTFQELAEQWSAHYNTNLDVTRPRKPKDKPTVENNVYISYLRIYSKLRNQQFFSLSELNQNIQKLLVGYNQTRFQKLEGSRSDRFLNQEKHLFKPLPSEPYTIKYTTKAKVQMNYHVILGQDRHQYSVPYQYIGQQTKLVYDQNTVEVYIGINRIAIHPRSDRKNGYTTIDEHMPERHLRYKETQGWDADYFLSVASKIGVYSREVFKQVLASKDFIEQTYKACIGLKRLAEVYQNNRFEAACQRALNGTRINYGVIKNILKNNLDKQNIDQRLLFEIPLHENIRGPIAYN